MKGCYFLSEESTACVKLTKTDKLIETNKYSHEEYPGNKLDEIADQVGSIMCELGDIIGHEIASQAFDACLNN